MAQFQAGQSGNPAGRPRGARSKLGEEFLKALADDFAANGTAVIQAVRAERPHEYLKVIAGILPKDLQLTGEDGGPLIANITVSFVSPGGDATGG